MENSNFGSAGLIVMKIHIKFRKDFPCEIKSKGIVVQELLFFHFSFSKMKNANFGSVGSIVMKLREMIQITFRKAFLRK